MKIDEAVRYAFDGDALLFLGAGFSVGATNISGANFAISTNLCQRLIEDGEISVKDEEERDLQDLAYVSELYLDNNTTADLMNFLKNECICKKTSESQDEILKLKWMRIYTTNYDDIVESSSKKCGILRESIIPESKPSEVLRHEGAIIHLNGCITNLKEKNLHDTFKLLARSYRKRTIPDSDWAISLYNDIQCAKCIIFIGYSLDYDMELQQIFSEYIETRDKFVFITHKPSRRALRAMQSFGEVYDIGSEGFAKFLAETSENYKGKKEDNDTKCLKLVDFSKEISVESVSDKDVLNLFFNGIISMDKLAHFNHMKYAVPRKYVQEIVEALGKENYMAALVHSDLGNGKTIFLRELEVALSAKGKVFYLERINQFLRNDMDILCNIRGMKFIVIENYNRIVDSEYIKLLSMYNRNDIKYIFSVRTYLNENILNRFLKRAGVEPEEVLVYDINKLEDEELLSMREILSHYALWGNRSTISSKEKMNYLKKGCDSEIKNIMLDLLDSPTMQKKIDVVTNTILENADLKEITLLVFICQLIATDITLSDVVFLLGRQVRLKSIINNDSIRELFEFGHNTIKLKSPIVASYILKKNNLNDDIERIIIKLLPVLDKHSSIENYSAILKMLVSYSNLRMIFSLNEKNYANRFIAIYERSKQLNFNKNNPFFWLQYAMARMDMRDYAEAAIYLENARAYADEVLFDPWQIDIQHARLLLERTVKENNIGMAFDAFTKAVDLLFNTRTTIQFYPLRQVGLIKAYYDAFYDSFTEDQRAYFTYKCGEILGKLNDEIGDDKQYEKKNFSRYNILRENRRRMQIILESVKNKEE